VLAGTATESLPQRVEGELLTGFVPRYFRFALIASESSLNEFLVGLKLDN
jgi:hypothetical protein